jgi:cell division protein FtsW
MVYSSTSIIAGEQFKDSAFFLRRQFVYLILGIIAAGVVMVPNVGRLRPFGRPLLLLSIVLLLLVFVPGIGVQVGGAKRWLRLGGISFQPSEFAQASLVFYLGDFLSRKANKLHSLVRGFIPPALAMGMMVLLVLLEPDLGTALAMVALSFLLFYVAGVPRRFLGWSLLLGLPLLYVLIFSVPYRRARFISFLNPWQDPKGSGFQLIQSQIALGSGGLFGQGLGRGRQKLFYLPAAHTDFIFSIIGEELGFLGAGLIIIVFILFLWRASRVVLRCPDMFGFFLGIGVVSLFMIKVIVNIGVSLGVFPTKGLPLPFLSYGGSSLVVDLALMGLLLNISRLGEVL